MKKLLLIIILGGLFMTSCGSKKKVTEKTYSDEEISIIKNDKQGTGVKYTNRDIDILKYIAKYKSIAQREMKEYGIPASITIAQGILESQAGKSELATRANNHFGVKCHKDWSGPRYLYDDDDIQECFRKYENPERSYVDHSKFLAHRKRYAFLFRLPKTDFEAWAKGLKKAGYATDPSYPDKLIYLINKYRLNELDKEVLKGMSIKVNDTAENMSHENKKFIYEVKKGETIFTVSNKFNIPVKKIQKINNLNDFDIYEGQILVLTLGDEEINNDSQNTAQKQEEEAQKTEKEVEIKNEQANEAVEVLETDETQIPEDEKYVVKEGQTLFSIAKENNIKIDDLLTANHFDKSTEIKVGQVIRIPKNKIIRSEEEKKDVEVQPEVSQSAISKGEAYKYTVKQGETIYSIARDHAIEVSAIMEANDFDNSSIIKVGQVILIPGNQEADANTKQEKSTTINNDMENKPVYHIVKQGETLYRIHVKYGVPVETLRKLNHLKGNNIKVGQKLRVK